MQVNLLNTEDLTKRRLLLISKASDLFGDISVIDDFKGQSQKVAIYNSESEQAYNLRPELVAKDGDSHVYNMPFLLNEDFSPWSEANSYLVSLVQYKNVSSRPTDDIRRKASRLLHYKYFCECHNIDWLDFSGKRPSNRPTYKYYRYLINDGSKSASVINQYTGLIYKFYEFVSKYWHAIDMERVDSVSRINFLINAPNSTINLERNKRSLTRPTGGVKPVPIGYVRDDGENLRPLSSEQLKELTNIISSKQWSAVETLIIRTAILTGARKQSILTLRLKHLEYFVEQNKSADGSYTLHAGPGTGIDTKFDKKQTLFIPKKLANDLIVYAKSDNAKNRRKKFIERFLEYPNLAKPEDKDIYLFLSDQGNCYYMAKDDKRYPSIRSRPTGQVTETLKRKIIKFAGNKFPRDFSFHWLRATYALRLYEQLQPLIAKGVINAGDEISYIQQRMHHKNRETTENYLKLFQNSDIKLKAQEVYETAVFDEIIQ